MTVLIEKFQNHKQYCKSKKYKDWLTSWTPPVQIKEWVDHEVEIFNYKTPRHRLHTSISTRLIFHLLDSIGIGKQKSIDIGCGTNFVAKYYDHVHGVDPYFPEYRNNSLTPDWFINNWQKWPLCFAINSMHFVPQSEIVNNINKISGLLTNKGKAIVTINRKMINEFTGRSYNSEELFDKLKTCNNLKHMLWFDNPKHADIDGNVWLYLEK